ncbi:MAG: hypothetical protein BAJALOKI1v1_1670004 [Promethearchaeota archaeon]|nr:MAG: hypothetical protein BAJALOKI1v1_1670004 [Candidatus Lokiarchaeota archaeon]
MFGNISTWTLGALMKEKDLTYVREDLPMFKKVKENSVVYRTASEVMEKIHEAGALIFKEWGQLVQKHLDELIQF